MVVKKRGQVWVETVTYTLIAFVMIGLVLAFAKPKIEQIQDKMILDQSIKMLKEIDTVIENVGKEATGNKRKIELIIKKGLLRITPVNNTLIFEMESKHIYSEPNEQIQDGDLVILTTERGKYNDVTVTLNYTQTYSIKYDNSTNPKLITKSSNPYTLFISNKGGGEINIEIN